VLRKRARSAAAEPMPAAPPAPGAAGRGIPDLQRARPDLLELGDAEHETDGVEDVGLATAVQARNRIELLVKALHDSALGVRLEAIDDDLLDVHPGTPPPTAAPRPNPRSRVPAVFEWLKPALVRNLY